MKNLTQKIISVFLSAVTAGGCFMSASAISLKYGDADNDGVINSNDALAVIEHSVGKEILAGDNFKRADVNADGVVDSNDALDILCYTVGMRDSFIADESEQPGPGNETDLSDNELLVLFNAAVSKARNDRPQYLLESDSKYTSADVTIKDPLNILKAAGGASAKELEKEMEESMLTETAPIKTVMRSGSTNSFVNLPHECECSDLSALKGISGTKLENGNYSIRIDFSDEKNPSAESPLCQVLGVADYDTIFNELKTDTEIEGAEGLTEVILDEISYKNAWITCEINPENNEIVNCQYKADSYIDSTVEIFALLATVSVKTVSSCTSTNTYSYFTY